jgi:hypothetical protein
LTSAAPRSPDTRKWVKNEAAMRSDSWATSLAALEVRKAFPFSLTESSVMKGGRNTPPLCRVSAPEAQESSTATRTSAGICSMRARSSG